MKHVSTNIQNSIIYKLVVWGMLEAILLYYPVRGFELALNSAKVSLPNFDEAWMISL